MQQPFVNLCHCVVTKKLFKTLDKRVVVWYNRSEDGGKYDRYKQSREIFQK